MTGHVRTPCLFCKLRETDDHCSISSHYLQTFSVWHIVLYTLHWMFGYKDYLKDAQVWPLAAPDPTVLGRRGRWWCDLTWRLKENKTTLKGPLCSKWADFNSSSTDWVVALGEESSLISHWLAFKQGSSMFLMPTNSCFVSSYVQSVAKKP